MNKNFSLSQYNRNYFECKSKGFSIVLLLKPELRPIIIKKYIYILYTNNPTVFVNVYNIVYSYSFMPYYFMFPNNIFKIDNPPDRSCHISPHQPLIKTNGNICMCLISFLSQWGDWVCQNTPISHVFIHLKKYLLTSGTF